MTLTNSHIIPYLKQAKAKIDEQLRIEISKLNGPKVLIDAMNYSLEAGGKRLRPIMLLATLEAFGQNSEKGIPLACAVEMLHTYSLIHDDLPAMDNDDLRRGKPTNHKVFGEANAILAGDALLTYSFEMIASLDDPEITSQMKVELIKQLAQAAGAEGMVGGQTEDLIAENNPNLTVEELEHIHVNKTGKLFIYSVLAGAILARANEEQMNHLEQFAYHLGIAFQIRDDILDIEGDVEKIGKPVGSDFENEKSTYPSLLTVDGAKKKLNEHVDKAIKFLYKANVKHEQLETISMYIIHRDN
ncbi:farnesyl-diphosphate synthase [Pueribacillus theae]|uniref:Farnesyl diphosphate synthase n=1 Tax=Pueribacillus theae TaxID=2171751 RepID=A0A2U1K7T0_9BACI|nr:farnesyl diphosphate synthase [Pueribacillus theae]PWA13209.1 farnesyl-diphosphate synthase [Pueribacillus theae]